MGKTLNRENIELTATLYVRGLSRADMAAKLLISPYTVTRRIRSPEVWKRIQELDRTPKKKVGRPKKKKRAKKRRHRKRRLLSEQQIPPRRKSYPYDPGNLVPHYRREEKEWRRKRYGKKKPPNFRILQKRARWEATQGPPDPPPSIPVPKPLRDLKKKALENAKKPFVHVPRQYAPSNIARRLSNIRAEFRELEELGLGKFLIDAIEN